MIINQEQFVLYVLLIHEKLSISVGLLYILSVFLIIV